jgi:chromosome segregation ATPase
MDNDKFQDLMLEHFGKVLNKLESMETHLGNVESRLGGVESRLDNLESRLGNVESRLDNLESRLTNVESELSEVKQSLITLENRVEKKLDALYYDWRDTQRQLNQEMATEIKNLGTKVEALQMESTKYDQQIKDITESKFYLVRAPNE